MGVSESVRELSEDHGESNAWSSAYGRVYFIHDEDRANSGSGCVVDVFGGLRKCSSIGAVGIGITSGWACW
jgi:hypothetical protein